MANRLNEKEAAGILSLSSSFSLVYHKNPDGDCLASCIALYHWLKAGKKQVQIVDDQQFFPSAFEEDMKQLPIVSAKEAFQNSLVVLLDCAEGVRTTLLEPEEFLEKHQVLVIDHHQSAKKTPHPAWIDSDAAATGEMLAELFQEIPEWNQPKSDYYCFLAIASDTGFFRYSNTKPKTFRLASNLKQNSSEIYQKYFQTATLQDTILMGKILQRLQFEEEILYTWITFTELPELHISDKPTEIFDQMLKIKNTSVAMLFKESAPQRWRVSLRQKNQEVDLSKFAEIFSGGGHRQAAAFSMRGDLETVKSIIFSKWKESSNL